MGRAGTRSRRRRRPSATPLRALLIIFALLVTSCASVVDGSPPVSALPIAGFSGSGFDVQVGDALSDIIGFWQQTYPEIANGAQLKPLAGKLYSVDGAEVIATREAPGYAASNKCLQKQLGFIVDNAAYCRLDDSIIWDRAPDHLVPVLADAYGPDLTALVFAHEFGHAIQQRLGLSQEAPRQIDLESQADCAAGAFAAYALAGNAPHFHFTAADLDRALAGYFQVRDSTPESPDDISHGNGFDRLSALQNGITHGAKYCFSGSYYKDLTYTERQYVNDGDYARGGNEPLRSLLNPDALPGSLNDFWARAGTSVHKTLKPVSLKQASRPACGASSAATEFAYCPADNTVYYTAAFAHAAYYSVTAITINQQNAVVTIKRDQPADFALGQMISIAWGMAARHQFFGGSTDDASALIAATCYSGAYAEDINRAQPDAQHNYILSPPDMDEATLAVLDLVPLDTAFGARGTTGLDRVQAFVKGYNGGLSVC